MSRSAAVKHDVITSITTFGDLLRYLRQRQQMTQRDLALAVGYSISQISRLEHNERLPDELTLQAVFVPALGLEQESGTVERLLALARQARGEAAAPSAPPASLHATVFPDPAAPPPTPKLTNLPHRLTSFIGREQEVAALQRLVQEHRLVTLTGVGGVGKSSLALAVAETLAFPDGVWLLELAPITEAGLIVRALADLFQLPPFPGRTPLETVNAFLQPKALLLLVDNCEHLIATCADLVDRLLQAAPHLHILTTSREALNTAGEREWALLPLPTPPMMTVEAAWPLHQLQPFAAAHLFMERAQAIKADLRFTDQDGPLLARICQQVDGIPLALELAAARCKSFTLPEIVARLADRFTLLNTGRRTALLRHQTLRATIDWSYDLLSPAEAALFRCLSVFVGGWTLTAAEQVADRGQDHPPTFDLLHQLVNKSLVIVDRSGDITRYGMLETIRQYAREKLVEQGEESLRCDQHATYFLRLAQQAQPFLQSTQQQVWYPLLLLEQNNFRSALHWWQANNDYGCVAQLGAALCWFWLTHGEIGEEMPRLEWALAAMVRQRATVSPAVYAKALYGVGLVVAWSGDLVRARRLFEEYLEIEEEPDSVPEICEVLGNLAEIAEWEGDFDRATQLNERYLALARSYNYRQGIAESLTNLGKQARLQGQYERARQLLQESLALRKAVGTMTGVVSALAYLSIAVRELGDFAEAQHLAEEALQLAYRLNDKVLLGGSLTEAGVIAQLQHNYEKAKQYQQSALTVLQEGGFHVHCALVLTRLGNLALLQADLNSAHKYFTESLALTQQTKSKKSLAFGLEGSAAVVALNERPMQAAHLLGAAEACREATRIARAIEERVTYERTVALVRAILGDAQFEAACLTGRTTALDEVILPLLTHPAHGL